MMRFPFFKQITIYLVFVMSLFAVLPRVDASMVDSEFLTGIVSQREADIQKIQRFLESEIVKKRLSLLGYTTEEIKSKLDALSDEELHQFAVRADQIRVGGDSGFSFIISVLIIAILIVLLLQVTGHRVVVIED